MQLLCNTGTSVTAMSNFKYVMRKSCSCQIKSHVYIFQKFQMMHLNQRLNKINRQEKDIEATHPDSTVQALLIREEDAHLSLLLRPHGHNSFGPYQASIYPPPPPPAAVLQPQQIIHPPWPDMWWLSLQRLQPERLISYLWLISYLFILFQNYHIFLMERCL